MTRPHPSPPSPPSNVEQELLSVVLELIPFVVFWKSRDLTYLGCNAAFAGLAEVDSPRDLVGLCDYDLPWSQEESDAYRADDLQVIESNQAKLHIVERQTGSDGLVTWLDTSKVPLRDKEGRVIGVLGVCADITEQRENEEELQRTRGYLEDAIRAMDSGIVLYDEQERLVFCNDRYADMYDMSPETLTPGRTYEEILQLYTDNHPQLPDPKSWVQERLDQHRRGTGEWLQTMGDRAIRVSDSVTDSKGVVSLRTDVTAIKIIEEELRKAKEAAELANEAKSAFLANMSHEIRTPMSAILGFTEILIQDSSDSATLESLETIKRNGESLLGLINDILDLSKVESGNLAAISEPCSPWQVVDNVAVLLGVRAKEKQVELVLESSGPIPASIQSDEDRLQQILLNLVGNALKFTSDGRVVIRTTWSGENEGGRLRFEIEDTGIGMDEEQLERVFRPFEQADSSTTRNFGGTGLGLAISKRLAELLGGQLCARSEPGKGSTFTLDIPVQGQVELSDGPSCRLDAQPPVVEAARPAERLTGLRVLLAEDGRDNQRLVTRVLARAGATVVVCEDGVEALKTLRVPTAEFDLVLMDMQMPRLDGYGATRQLRESGFAKPIVALTAHAMSGDREACLEAGCSDYLTKPIKFAALIDACARVAREAA